MSPKKTTFFFSDIVGYSKMVEQDEILTHKLLQEHNRILSTEIEGGGGSIVKYIGDAVFAEFSTPTASLDAALAIQRELKNRNDLSREAEKIRIRIGVHSGTAIRENDDLFGNDINITSRIESVAQPESVFISDTTFHQLDSEKEYFTHPVNQVKLKNIHVPFTLYKLYPDKTSWEEESPEILTDNLIESGVSFITQKALDESQRRSLGILVFQSINDELLGYGLTKDIINEFDRISQIYVADIQDVMRFKSRSLSPADIARKLEVDYIIDGVCREQDNRIHLSMRMLSMTNGKTIWKEEFSDLTANINVLRVSAVKKILEVLELSIPEFILNKMTVGMTSNTEAYRLYHEGNYQLEIIRNTKEYKNIKSKFQKAIELDKNFLEAYAHLAIINFKMGHTEEAEDIIEDGFERADERENEQGKAKLLDALGIVNSDSVKFRKAVKNFHKALKIHVKFEDQLAESKTLNNLSQSYLNLQETNKAIESLEKSVYLKEKLEKDNLIGSSLAQLGNAYRKNYQIDKGIRNYQKALGKFTRYDNEYLRGRVLTLLARSYTDLGMVTKARSYLEMAVESCEKFNEPLVMGRLKHFESNLHFLEKDFKKAVSCQEAALEIFLEGELRAPAAEMYLELITTHIIFDHPEPIYQFRNKYDRIAKKLKNVDKDEFLLYSIDNFMNETSGENSKLIEPEEILPGKFIEWWILSKSARMNDNISLEKKYIRKAVQCIHSFAEKLMDVEMKLAYLNKYPVGDILKKP